MSNSKENDNGRYFEYLISKELEEKFGVSASAAAVAVAPAAALSP